MSPNKPTSSSAKKSKGKTHTTFKEKVHNGTEYLKRMIIPDEENSTRFICIGCRGNKKRNIGGFCENLRSHLLNKAHQEILKDDNEKKECLLSVKFLERGEEAEPLSLKQDDVDDSEEDTTQQNEEIKSKKKRVLKERTDTHLKFDLTTFIVNNNLPFNLGPKLMKFMQECFDRYDPLTISQVKITNHQVSQIVVECLSSEMKQRNLSLLESSPFSISVDEGTDKLGKTYLAISARLFTSLLDNEPEDKLLGLLEVGDSSTGEALYKKIKDFIFSSINKEKVEANFMGICCDHSSNMISEKEKGLAERLKKDYPHIFIIHDYSHIFNLVMQEAIDQFPPEIIKIISNICACFGRSSQKKFKFKEIQKGLGINNTLEILRYVPHRWSSLHDAVERIISLLQPLRIFFEKYGNTTQISYLSKENEMYLKLLLYLLKKLNVYIKFFQGDNLSIKEITTTLKECMIFFGESVVEISSNEVTTEALQNIFNKIYQIPFEKEEDYLPLVMDMKAFTAKFYEDHATFEQELQGMDKHFIESFLKVAFKFFIASLERMKYWLPFEDQAIFDSEVIHLETYDMNKWKRLKERFTNIIKEKDAIEFTEQLKRFKINFPGIKSIMGKKPLLEVWKEQEIKFPLLSKLAKALMVMPYSSCFLERTFSKIVDIKTLKRNRLSINGLEACLLIKQEHSANEFQISQEMIIRYKKINESSAQCQIEAPSDPVQAETMNSQEFGLNNQSQFQQMSSEALDAWTRTMHTSYLLANNYSQIPEPYAYRDSSLKRISNDKLKPDETKKVKKEGTLEISSSKEPLLKDTEEDDELYYDLYQAEPF